MNNGVNKQRKKFREALLYCLTEEDIQDHIKTLTNISQDTQEKTANRLKAIQLIFDYSVGKPKQDFGIEMEGKEEITGFTVRTVDHITKGIEKYYLDYNEYITAIERGEIKKNEKALIGDYEKEIEMENDIKRMKEEHNLE